MKILLSAVRGTLTATWVSAFSLWCTKSSINEKFISVPFVGKDVVVKNASELTVFTFSGIYLLPISLMSLVFHLRSSDEVSKLFIRLNSKT